MLNTILELTLKEKAKNLENILKTFSSPFYIACSGGLDSRFLAYFSQKIGCNIKLLHIVGSHTDPSESTYLQSFAEKENISLQCIHVDIFENKAIAQNHKDRCYYCKYKSFKVMLEHSSSFTLCDGSHADDLHSFRPGLKALSELGIISPLARANINKADIKKLAQYIGLENPNQKARPCMLTRFAYNHTITQEEINQIIQYEKICDEIFVNYYGKNNIDFRVRLIDGIYTLHYVDFLDSTIISALQNSIINAKLLPLKIVQLQKLSGFFDK